jgi:hypothetical protein
MVGEELLPYDMEEDPKRHQDLDFMGMFFMSFSSTPSSSMPTIASKHLRHSDWNK